MGYRTLGEAVNDLEQSHQLVRIDQPIDPDLVAGAIQRRVYQHQGPALLFTNLKGCRFPAVANLYGTWKGRAISFAILYGGSRLWFNSSWIRNTCLKNRLHSVRLRGGPGICCPSG